MRSIRSGRQCGRRRFLRQAGQCALAAGVLAPLWNAVAENGDIARAYPEELLSIEAYTRGRIRSGEEITAANVEWVKELLEPIRYGNTRRQQLRAERTTRASEDADIVASRRQTEREVARHDLGAGGAGQRQVGEQNAPAHCVWSFA